MAKMTKGQLFDRIMEEYGINRTMFLADFDGEDTHEDNYSYEVSDDVYGSLFDYERELQSFGIDGTTDFMMFLHEGMMGRFRS